MKLTTVLLSMATFWAFCLEGWAHHHTDPDTMIPGWESASGASEEILFLAEVSPRARASERASPDGRAAAEVDLSGKRVAVLIGEGFHDGETTRPSEYLSERGAEVVLLGTEPASLTAYNSDLSLEVEATLSGVCVPDFDALIIPGGRSPANLREDRNVQRFVRAFVESGKPVAAICHGPQVLASAGVLSGRTVTGVGGIRDEITDAGANFKDEAVVQDKNLITSRVPRDLPVFNTAIADSLAAR